MFQFFKNLFCSKSKSEKDFDDNINMFVAAFDVGNFESAIFYLKKMQIPCNDVRITNIFPQIEEYLTPKVIDLYMPKIKSIVIDHNGEIENKEKNKKTANLSNKEDADEGDSDEREKAAKYVLQKTKTHILNKSKNENIVIPSFVEFYILRTSLFRELSDKFVGIKIKKNNPQTSVFFFSNITIDIYIEDFKSIPTDNIDILYLWIDHEKLKSIVYSKWGGEPTQHYFFEYDTNKLKKIPKKKIIFGGIPQLKDEIAKFVSDLSFLGYDVEHQTAYNYDSFRDFNTKEFNNKI